MVDPRPLVSPLQEVMAEEAPTSYTMRQGSSFAQLIADGCFQVVKGEYFEHMWLRRDQIQKRQDIPEVYLWRGEEAVELWQAYGPLFLVTISYAWLSEEHPDPECWHLERLANAIASFRMFRERLKLKDESLGCHLLQQGVASVDVGIIMDWCSLWHRHLWNGEDTRSERQVQQFKQGLSEINTPYGHEAIMAWVLNEVPEAIARRYDDRGWTFFEKCIIDAKGTWDIWVRTSMVIGGRFAGACEPQHLSDSFGNDPDAPPVSYRRAPLTPARFDEELETLGSLAQERGVKLFTNGHEDRPLVQRKYRDSYRLLTQSRNLSYRYCEWRRQDLMRLLEALPDFAKLERLNLRGNHIDTKGARDMAEHIQRHCPQLKFLVLSHNEIGLLGQLAMVVAWRSRDSERNPACLDGSLSCVRSWCCFGGVQWWQRDAHLDLKGNVCLPCCSHGCMGSFMGTGRHCLLTC
mmetsp:Transcript_78188/g.242420  ORF Transcript_78188/g.242420 Transcript_78188/m.242420 type:complete len:463 (+) Transcript_78188:111-1499(+)